MPEVKGETRRQKADATRHRIIAAARDEFLEKGYHGATFVSIARRAGVAVQTAYFVFHTKPELISAVIDVAVMGEDEPTIPEQTEWWAAMEAEPLPDRALRLFIQGAAPLFARASGISEVLRAAALADEEVRRTYEHHEQLRQEGFQRVIETIAAKGGLKAGLDVGSATDILMTIFGDTVYDLLTSERGWSHERVIDWLCETLPVLLLHPAG